MPENVISTINPSEKPFVQQAVNTESTIDPQAAATKTNSEQQSINTEDKSNSHFEHKSPYKIILFVLLLSIAGAVVAIFTSLSFVSLYKYINSIL